MNELDCLGRKYRDCITGYEGICVAVMEWMYGCRQLLLKAQNKDNPKDASAVFFPAQLDEIGERLENIQVPEYTAPEYYGLRCRDKVTRQTGICIGRITHLYAEQQYVLEHVPADTDKETWQIWLDKGRIAVIDGAEHVEPEDVQSSRPGGIFDTSYYNPEREERSLFGIHPA